jgi:hypothetical protein
MRSVAAEERGERAWPFLRLLVCGARERAGGMGDDLVEVSTEAQTFLGQAPGTREELTPWGHCAHPLPCATAQPCRRRVRAAVVPCTETVPNQALHLTAYSVRCASASGSR